MISSPTLEYKTKPKLLQVSATLDKRLGGPTSVVRELKPYFNHEFEHEIFVFGKSDFVSHKIETIPTIMGNRYGLFPFPVKSQLRKRIANADIIIIHGFYLFSTLFSVAVSKTRNIFLMPHGSLEAYQERKGKFRKRLFRLAMKVALGNRTMQFLVASEAEVESVSALFPNCRINIVGLGIPDVIAYGKNKVTDKHQPLRLLCFSRISEKKRIDLCIQALAELNKREDRYLLTIAGTGDPVLVQKLQALCKKLDLDNHVDFRGHLADEVEIRSLFEESDIFLLPSENENFAIAVSESIGFSVPVIVSKFVAMHDFVDEHSTGVTLVDLSIPALVEAILEVEQNYRYFKDSCEKSRGLLSWTYVSRNWIRVLMDSEFS